MILSKVVNSVFGTMTMRISSLLWLILNSTFHSNAQFNPNQLFEKGKQLYFEGYYDSSIVILERTKKSYEKVNNSIGVIGTDYAIGENLANMGKCDQAIALISASLNIAENQFGSKDSITAEGYYYLSRAYGGCGRQYDTAIHLLKKSINIKTEIFGEESEEVAFDYNYMGYFLYSKGEYDSATQYLDRALKIRNSGVIDQVELSHTLAHLATVSESKGNLKTALELNMKALVLRKEELRADHPTISNSVNSIGNIYKRYGNFDQALKHYLEALQIRKNTLGTDHPNVAGSYYTIGNLHGSNNNYHRAIEFVKQGNRIFLNSFGEKTAVLHTYYAYLGTMYSSLGHYEEAEKWLHHAKSLSDKYLSDDHAYRGIVYNSLGNYYEDRGDDKLQSMYHKEALRIYKIAFGAESLRVANVMMSLGILESKISNGNNVEFYFSQAQQIFENKMGEKNSSLGMLNKNWGDIESELGELKNAIFHYMKGLEAISEEDSISLNDLPDLENLNDKPLAYNIIGKIAAVTYRSYLKTQSPDLLKRSLKCYKYAIDLNDVIASGYHMELSKSQFQEDSRIIYEQAIHVAYELYKSTNDSKYKNEAFQITERSKSTRLLTQERDKEAKRFTGVPDSLLDKERDLKIELTYVNKQLRDTKANNNEEIIAVYQKTLFEVREDFEQLKQLLQNEYSTYFNHKFNQSVLTYNEVREDLKLNEAGIVEYFEADTAVYMFTMTPEIFEFEKIVVDDTFYQTVNNYQKSITDHEFIVHHPREADSLYISSATKLYNVLLGQSEVMLSPIDQLTIVPDNKLSQINFGTLLAQQESMSNVRYADLSYLLKKHTISYAYSTTWKYSHSASTSSPTSENSFGGFAPSYEAITYDDIDSVSHPMTFLLVRSGNLPLLGAISEVAAISDLMNGDPWLKEDASETNFKNNAGNYNIIHLAMHSLLNSDEPEYSELLFNATKDSLNDGYLYVNEIYNLDLNAELVVLSACSSGLGKIQIGEGPISLSRAFSYAGCPSVIMSMWKIPDEATRSIMIAFYENLNGGQNKDEALKNAQLQYLLGTDDPLHQHPYYWASFLAMGDTRPIVEQPNNWVNVAVYVFSIALILFAFFRKHFIK